MATDAPQTEASQYPGDSLFQAPLPAPLTQPPAYKPPKVVYVKEYTLRWWQTGKSEWQWQVKKGRTVLVKGTAPNATWAANHAYQVPDRLINGRF